MAPFLLLSALGGEFADRFDKAAMARRLKLVEIGAAALAVLGIALSSIPILLAALFAVRRHLGAVRPDQIRHPAGSSRAQGTAAAPMPGSRAATFAAILAGTIVGGIASADGISVAVFGPMMMGLAVACWLVSRYIPPTGSAAPDLVIDKNILRSTWRLVSEICARNSASGARR